VVAIAAYFDDSWEANTFAMAGYVGSAPMWDTQFSPTWWNVINAAPHTIKEFKTANCRQMAGEFRAKLGWTRAECDALTRDLVSVIVESPGSLFGIGAAVTFTDDDLRDKTFLSEVRNLPFDVLKVRAFNFARTWCASIVAYDALRLAERHLGGDRIHIIYDQGSDRQWKMHSMFDTLRGMVRPDYAARISPPQFLPSHECAPLQAADLLAHETFKEMKNRSENPPRTRSKALARLTAGQPHVAQYFRLLEILRVVRENRAGDSRSIAWPPIYDTSKTEQIVRDIVWPERQETK
jgi:hypothetical protein